MIEPTSLRRERRELQAPHAVAGRQRQVVELRRPADDRQAVGGARPQPAPDVQARSGGEGRDRARGRVDDRVHAPLVDAQVGAGELERAGEADAGVVGRDDDAVLVQPDRQVGVTRLRFQVHVVALAALQRQREVQVPGEAAAPDAGGQHDLVDQQLAVRGLQRADAPPLPAYAEHLRACADGGAQLGRPGAGGEHEPQRVAVRLLAVEDAARQLATQLRRDLGDGRGRERLAGAGVARGGERLLAAEHVEQALLAVAGVEAGLVELAALAGAARGHRLQHVGGALHLAGVGGRDEAREPRASRPGAAHDERAVGAQHPADAVADGRGCRERLHVARADDPGVAGRAAPGQLGTALEDDDRRALLASSSAVIAPITPPPMTATS